MNGAYAFFALRYISRKNIDRGARRIRSSIIAIALSLIPVITVIHVSTGMIEGITRRFLEIGTFHMQVRFFGEIEREGIPGLVEEVESLTGVVRAFPFIEGTGLAYSQTGNRHRPHE